jgi:hypothetical protein
VAPDHSVTARTAHHGWGRSNFAFVPLLGERVPVAHVGVVQGSVCCVTSPLTLGTHWPVRRLPEPLEMPLCYVCGSVEAAHMTYTARDGVTLFCGQECYRAFYSSLTK